MPQRERDLRSPDREKESEPETAQRSTHVAVLGSLALVIAVVAVYLPVKDHQFVAFDTGQYILANRHVLNGLSWEGVRWAFTAAHSSNWHPLTWISHMLDVSLFGIDPGRFHLVNLAWHTLNSVLVFLVLRRMTAAVFESLIVAFLFGLHPMHVESVAWVVERKDLLSAFFGFGSLWFYAAWVREEKLGAYLLALALFACGLMSKPMLVTWPFVLLLLDVWPLARRDTPLSGRLIEKIPWFALSIASAMLTVWAQNAGGAIKALAYVPLSSRLSNAAVSYVRYVEKTFWPTDLSAFYPHPLGGLAARDVALALAMLIAISAAAFFLRKRAKFIAIGWLFFLGTLVPVIGIVQVGEQAMADRYSYIPTIGLFVIVAFGLRAACARSPVALVLARALEVASLVPLTLVTVRQIATWQDTRTLCEHALAAGQESHAIHDMLANALTEENRVDEAVANYRAALRIMPDDGYALENLGVLLAKRGDTSEAEQLFRRILSIQKNHPAAHKRMGMLRQAQGQLAEALDWLQKSAALDPSDSETFNNRGGVLERLGRRMEAEADYKRAIELYPGWTIPLKLLANLQLKAGRLDEAFQTAGKILGSEPASAEARRIRARVLLAHGDALGASAMLESVVKEFPDWPAGLADLAWIRATASEASLVDAAQALEMCNRALAKGGGSSAAVLDSLAAAQAAHGQLEAAAQTAARAAAAARAAPDEDYAARIERRMQAYRQGRFARELPR